MNTQLTISMMLATALTSAAALCQQPAPQLVAARSAGFTAVVATPDPLLELRLAQRDVLRLELRGGAPGTPAQIALGRHRDGAPALGCGTFDTLGCFSFAVDLDAYAGSTFVGQGFAMATSLDGSWQLLSSNGLEVQVPVAVPVAAPVADFSLLRIELDARHGDAALQDIVAGDFVGALDAALNSSGDALLAKVQGKVMVVVPGTPVQVGGLVGFSAQISRDGEDYLVAIGQEVAVLCGMKAAKNVGVEGGVSLGADQIHRFASPAEVARGLFGIALQQALPNVMRVASSENLEKVRRLRANVAGLFRALEALRSRRVCRLPAVERALDAALGVAQFAYTYARRVGDRLEQVSSKVVNEAEFVRRHVDGTEVRVATTGEVSLKLGDRKLGDTVGAELGGKVNGGYQLTIRTFQVCGEQVTRVEVLAAHSIASTFAAGVKLGNLTDNNESAFGRGFEVSQKVTRGVLQVFERRGGDFGAPTTSLVIVREFGLPGFGRKTTFSFDAEQLAGQGLTAVQVALDGEAANMLHHLAAIEVAVLVQDRRICALKPEFGVENTGLTAKVGGEFSWSDCGPARQTQWTLCQVVELLADIEARAAEAAELVQQVLELSQEN